MTEHDSRTTSGYPLNHRPGTCDATPDVGFEIGAGIVKQSSQGLAAVVAGHVGVEVLPNSLDAIRIRAVGREEVKDNSAAESLKLAARGVRGMDAVVVNDEVHTLGLRVALGQEGQQAAEQRRSFSRLARRVQGPRPNVKRAGQVELLVLAGRKDAALLSWKHPIAPNLRVEVYIHLVRVQHGLVDGCSRFESPYFREALFSCIARPRAEDDWLGRAEPGPKVRQNAAHRADVDLGPTILLHLQAEQLTGPCRPTPSGVLRSPLKELGNPSAERRVRLRFAVGTPLVVEPSSPLGSETVRRSHDRRSRDIQLVSHLGTGLPQPKFGHDVKPEGRLDVVAFPSELDEVTPLRSTNSRYNVHA